MGMVSELHPKPKAQLPTQPAPAVSSAKGTTQRQQHSPSQYRQSGQPSSTSFIQSGVHQQQAISGHARSPTCSETQDEDEEDEEETDSDEDDDEDDEQPDPG